MTRRRRGAAAVSIVMLLTLTACGSDDSSTSDSTTVAVDQSTPQPSAAGQTAPDQSASDQTAAPGTTPDGTTPDGTAPDGTTTIGPTPSTPSKSLGDPVVTLTTVATVDDAVDLAWRANEPTSFIVSQDGEIVPMRGGQVGDAVLDITDLTSADGERGLLGLTFAPDGATAYIDYTDNDGNTVIASYAVDADGVFDPDSRAELLTIDQPYPNHNGGNVMIGPDGMLYIGMGDGGDAGDPQRNGLNVGTLLGKILRIDPTGGSPYAIPPGNPFVDVDGAKPEIWAVGVRNPWRMSFDPATGDMWIADVGQGAVEEVDVAWAADGAGRGLNFGWSAFEGSTRYNDDQSADGVTPPIYEYRHGDAGCSISGGAMYRGTAVPALVGWFVFGDYCSGNLYAIQVIDHALSGSLLLGAQPAISAVRAGPDGELYVLSVNGTISRITAG